MKVKVKKKNKYIACVVMLILLAMISGYKIKEVNKRYPSAKVELINKGVEKVIKNNIKLQVLNSEWKNQDEIYQQYGNVSELVDRKVKSETVLVEVELENLSNRQQKLELYNFYIETTGYSNGISPELFDKINNKSILLSFEPKEKIKIKLPYTIYKNQFTNKQWENIEKAPFFITEQFYPEKECFSII